MSNGEIGFLVVLVVPMALVAQTIVEVLVAVVVLVVPSGSGDSNGSSGF